LREKRKDLFVLSLLREKRNQGVEIYSVPVFTSKLRDVEEMVERTKLLEMDQTFPQLLHLNLELGDL